MPRALPRRRLYGLLNLLVLPSIGLICIGSNLVFAAQVGRENPPDPLDYSLTSLSGSYAFVGTYGDHVAANLGVAMDDFEYAPFNQQGGLGKVHQLFGAELTKVIEELNRELAA